MYSTAEFKMSDSYIVSRVRLKKNSEVMFRDRISVKSYLDGGKFIIIGGGHENS